MQINDSDLIQKLKSLVQSERGLLAEVLRHLREVEKRQLYLQRGYSSMFSFCTEALSYSEAEAHIRIQAMRLMTAVPMVEEKLESGELSLSVAARAQACFRKIDTPTSNKVTIVKSLLGKSTRQAERELATHFPEPSKPEIERATTGELTRLEFTISKTCLEKLNRLRGRTAHKNFSGRLDIVFEALLDLALEKYDRPVAATPVSASPINATPVNATLLGARKVIAKRTRYIAAAVRREVWRRAEGQCQYYDQNSGHRCSSRYAMQIDHIKEYAQGGASTLENLQLLCGAHNRWRSQATG